VNTADAGTSLLGDFAGWILFGVNLLLPLMGREIRGHQRMALVFWASLLLRQTLALSVGFISGPYSDANWFHDWAIVRARELGLAGVRLAVGGEFYERLLGAAYDVLGASPFLAAQLSVLAFSASMIVFANIVSEFGITRHRAGLLALYSLPFSALYFTSTILREAYQLLAFVVAVYAALRYRRSGSPIPLVVCCLSAFVMGLFHDGLIVFSGFFLALVFLWPVGSRREHGSMTNAAFSSHRTIRRLGVAVIMVVFAVGGSRAAAGGLGSGALSAILSERAFEFAARYREGGLRIQARTNYDVRLDASSPPAFALSTLRVFVYYLFTPFPWQVRSPADVLGGAEAVLRFFLLAIALRELRRSSGAERRTRAFLLVAYFGLAGLWSLGTVNYGTAFRHHVTTNWILIVVGGPRLLESVAGLLRTLAGRRTLARA
jgi:hypothetical protein